MSVGSPDRSRASRGAMSSSSSRGRRGRRARGAPGPPRRRCLAGRREMAGGSTSSAIRSSSVFARRARRRRARRAGGDCARYSPLRSSRRARPRAARGRVASRRSSRSRAARGVAARRSRSSRSRSSPRRVLLVLVLVLIIVALARPLLLEAGAALVEHAEIMVRILKIIFGLDAVALHLRVAREALIFLEQLGGVAALPIVLAVARTRIVAARRSTAAAAAAAPAAALSIVDQTMILTKGGSTLPSTGRALPGLLSCTTREARRRTCDSSHHSETASSQATKPSGVGDVRPSRILCCGRPRPCPLCSQAAPANPREKALIPIKPSERGTGRSR